MPDLFNPQMLRLARELRGLSQKQFSEIVGIEQGLISKWEAGLYVPPDDKLNVIANTLRFPLGFFYREGRVYPPEAWSYYCNR